MNANKYLKLRNCPGCTTLITADEKTCPHCNHPIVEAHSETATIPEYLPATIPEKPLISQRAEKVFLSIYIIILALPCILFVDTYFVDMTRPYYSGIVGDLGFIISAFLVLVLLYISCLLYSFVRHKPVAETEAKVEFDFCNFILKAPFSNTSIRMVSLIALLAMPCFYFINTHEYGPTLESDLSFGYEIFCLVGLSLFGIYKLYEFVRSLK